MRLPEFDHLAPKTVREACDLLSEHNEKAKVIAGGTDLLVRMKQKLLTHSCLIDLKGIPELEKIVDRQGGSLRIGALSRLRSIESSPPIKDKFSLLSQAAGRVATLQIRNMATMGGNLCLDSRCWYYNQSPFWRRSRPLCYKRGGDLCHVVKGGDRCYALCQSDTAPALMALGARVRIVSSEKERVIALKDFFTGEGKRMNVLQPHEFLAEIQLPFLPPHTGGVYLKESARDVIDFPVLGVAVVLTLKPGNGSCGEAKIVLGAVSSAPVEAGEAEEVLKGKKMTEGLIEEAAKSASKEVRPFTQMGIPASYKKRMVQVFVKQALKEAWRLAQRP